MTFAVSMALLGGGAAAVIGGAASFALLSLGLLGAIVCTILSVGIGIERFPFESALSLIILPWLLFLYAIGQQVLAQVRPDGGYLLLALGFAAMTRSLFVREKLAAPQHEIEVHAH